MRGYYGQPEATAEVIKDGWFYTGDVGHMDKQGRLYITDRKKDLFKLSNGKYVAPQLIESLLKQSEFVSQVVVVGAGRKQPVALIVPDWENLNEALAEAGEDAPKNRDALSKFPPAVKMVQQDISSLTSSLADYERIRRVALLPNEFTIDGGELTPTLKVKAPRHRRTLRRHDRIPITVLNPGRLFGVAEDGFRQDSEVNRDFGWFGGEWALDAVVGEERQFGAAEITRFEVLPHQRSDHRRKLFAAKR